MILPKATKRQCEPYTEMTFGKYKGEPVEEVPISYLNWCLENMDLSPEQTAAFENEVMLRED